MTTLFALRTDSAPSNYVHRVTGIKKSSETLVLLAGIKAAITRAVTRRLQQRMVYYSFWDCRCGSNNISYHSDPEALICERAARVKRFRKKMIISIDPGTVVARRASKLLRIRIERCRCCSRQVYLVTSGKS